LRPASSRPRSWGGGFFCGVPVAAPQTCAQASAAVIVWKEAFEQASAFDAAKLREALSKLELDSFYGRIDFDDSGRNIGKPMVLRQIQNGEYKVVAPTKWASSKLVFPPPAAGN